MELFRTGSCKHVLQCCRVVVSEIRNSSSLPMHARNSSRSIATSGSPKDHTRNYVNVPYLSQRAPAWTIYISLTNVNNIGIVGVYRNGIEATSV